MQKEDFTSSSFTEPLYKCDHKRSKCDKCEHDHHDCGCHHHEHHCDCHHDIFPPNYHVIDNMCELKKLLSEVFVRFDNDPSAYQKDDFRVLLKVMAQSLIYLYKRDKNAVMSYRVDSLPALGEFGAIYIVPKPEEEQTEYNKFDEWLSLGECGWELIGGNAGAPQPVDFSGIESETLDVTVPEEGEPWKIELPEDIIELLNEVKQFAERIDALEAKAHVHENKALLDTYKQTEADLADAVAKKHIHENLDELDKIEDGDVEKWNQASLKSYDVVLAENEEFLEISSSTENLKTTFELSTSGIKELVKAEEDRATDVECRISDMASAAKSTAEAALGKVNVLESKVTNLTTRVSAVEKGLQTESETRASAVAELKADLALEMQNRADADTVLRQDINTNAQEIADLKARTLWVKKGEEAAVQVTPNENNEYIIPVPAACDCKLSQVYTSPYKIGGIEVGDQFGPGCELGDSFEDLVRRMFTIPPVTYTAYMGSLPTADFSVENIKSLDSHVFDSELIGQRAFNTRAYLTIAIPSEFTVYAETVEEPIVSVSDQFSKREGVEIDGDLYDVYYMAVRSASDPVYNYKIYK